MSPETKNLTRHYLSLILSSVFLLSYISNLKGQKIDKLYNKASQLYQEEKYEKASKSYLKIIESDTYYEDAFVQLARCYQQMERYEEADKFFSQLFTSSSTVNPVYFLEYGQLLMILGRNDEARSYFTSYNNLIENNDPRVLRYIKSIEDRDKYYLDSAFIHLDKLQVSSEGDDLNPFIYNQRLIFETNKDFVKSAPTFNSLLIEPISELSERKAKEISGALASKSNSYGFSIATSTGELFRSVKDEKISPDQILLFRSFIEDNGRQLSKAEQVVPEGWRENIAFPAVNATGDIMVFSSDSKTGTGGWDLFICRRGTYGYSEPLPLPGFINTQGDEKYPYLANDSILFFTSDGHGGLGGYDLYFINLNTVNAIPKNLGYPVNSHHNEFGLCLNDNQSAGYISSDRSSGNTFGDLYGFTIDQIRAIGVVTDRTTGENLKNVAVEIKKEGQESAHLVLADNGHFTIVGIPGETYDLNVWCEGYTLESYKVATADKEVIGLYEVDMGTFPIEPTDKQIPSPLPEETPLVIEEEPVVPEAAPVVTPVSSTIFRLQIAASRVPLTDQSVRKKYKGDKDIFMFEEEGWYKYAIGEFTSYFEANKERKLCGVKDAFIAAYKQGQGKITLKAAIKEVHIQPAKIQSEHYDSNDVRTSVQKYIVYFPFDSYEPNHSEILRLNLIYDTLAKDLNLRAEINGHSDIQGSSGYNFGLSLARADFIKDYLIDKGIEPDRINVVSYGEERLAKQCEKDCTPAIHKVNRRAEITVYR